MPKKIKMSDVDKIFINIGYSDLSDFAIKFIMNNGKSIVVSTGIGLGRVCYYADYFNLNDWNYYVVDDEHWKYDKAVMVLTEYFENWKNKYRMKMWTCKKENKNPAFYCPISVIEGLLNTFEDYVLE